MIEPPKREAWWVPGAHLQTIWARIARSRELVRFEREILPTPDGDELVLDHLAGPSSTPRVLLLHGLEGSAHSWHTQGLALLVKQAGWRATALNFRSCAVVARQPLPNRRPRLYHSGDTADLELVVRTLIGRQPETPLFALGFSLGGNVLLKWLGEQGPTSVIRAAAVISVPYDLAAASAHLEQRGGRFYVRHFLKKLRPKALHLLARFPAETAHLDAERIRGATTFRDFDDCITAPLHGFAGAEDYYQRSSSLNYLSRIAVPTLCISSNDDPFYPARAIEPARRVASPAVTFAVTPWGGHVGFVAGRWPWRPIYWAEEQAVAWLQTHAGSS
ncbi:MAG: alpha/beta fold hydrolase [Myxococcales bacterium]